MEIVKKNILSIICGVVALLALISLLWPISGMYSDEETKVLKPRVAVDGEINGLIHQRRTWPVIPGLQAADKASLDRFPNEEVIKAGIVIKDSVHKQAEEMRDRTVRDQEATHPLLYAGSLPDPKDLRFRFQTDYLDMVQDKVVPNSPTQPSKLKADLRGGLPPTDADVLAAAQVLWEKSYKPKLVTVVGKDVNFGPVEADWQKECSTLQAKLRLQTAQKLALYIDPDWISIQKAMQEIGKSPNETDIWFAQNMLWVQMDLIDGIKKINSGSRDVRDATVKHIFRIDVPDDQNMYVQGTNTGSQPAAVPAGDAAAPKVFTASMTGRVCNPLYDVIQFQMVIDVDATKIPIIIKQLQQGKLLTVEQVDMSPVDGIAAANDGFIYGNVPVTKLTIRGEELFLRDWTVKYMPEQIKQMLQVPPPPANAAH